MAWNPQGGGQGPWGTGSTPPQPPDFEDLLRRGQARFKRLMPGGTGSVRGIIIILVVIAIGWLATGLYRIEAGHQGVVLLFGKFVQATEPGLHWFFPSPIARVLEPNVEGIRSEQIGYRGAGDPRRGGSVRDIPEESLMLTGDQNIADLDFLVQWKVKDAANFEFNIRDPQLSVRAVAESAMREVIGQTNLQPAMTGERQQVGEKTHALLQGILDEYRSGITITRVQLLIVDPPTAVIDSFNEVQRARQDKTRKLNEAEAYRNKIVPTARGEAAKLIQDATAYKERVVKEGEGEAKRFLSVYEAYKGNKEVTARRLYLERMQDILSRTNMVIIDRGSGAGTQGVLPYLPLPAIESRRKEAGK